MEGSSVVVENVVYSGLPEVYDIHCLGAGDEAQHQQQQVAHHPAQSSQLQYRRTFLLEQCHEVDIFLRYKHFNQYFLCIR